MRRCWRVDWTYCKMNYRIFERLRMVVSWHTWWAVWVCIVCLENFGPGAFSSFRLHQHKSTSSMDSFSFRSILTSIRRYLKSQTGIPRNTFLWDREQLLPVMFETSPSLICCTCHVTMHLSKPGPLWDWEESMSSRMFCSLTFNWKLLIFMWRKRWVRNRKWRK